MIKTKKCKHGVFMYLSQDPIGESLTAYGEYSESEIDIFQHFIKPGMVVIDAGAHFGSLTVPFAKMVGPKGRVLAFEPQRYIFYHLCGNVALNELQNVDCFNAAIGKEKGITNVPNVDYQQPYNFGSIQIQNSEKGYSVDLVNIDSVGLNQCDFLKIDVESMEPDVLIGATKTIERYKPVINVESIVNTDVMLDLFHGWKYRTYSYKCDVYNADNFFGNKQNIVNPPNAMSYGILALPPGTDLGTALDSPAIIRNARSPLDPPK